MEIEKLWLKDACVIKGFYSADGRGGFFKSFEENVYRELGVEFCVTEVFTSRSSKNVVRGIHFQLPTPQAKLVSVVNGRAIDIIVDLRLDSETYLEWISVELCFENAKAVYIPKGFGHAFLALEDDTTMQYLCDGRYDAKGDTGILIDDSRIGIEWPVSIDDLIISDRDRQLMSVDEYEKSIKSG